MSTISMPGFTAERSLYASAESYRSTAAGPRRDGAGVIPAQGVCLPLQQTCGACIPQGPSIFSPGRQFCQTFTCRPTFSGGCQCRLFSKGFQSCRPFDWGGGVFSRS